MDNLNLILESIRKKGEEEKNQILKNAQDEADKIINKFKEKAEKESQAIIDKAKKDSNLIIQNEDLSSKRKARDIKISAKNELLNEILTKVLSRLRQIDKTSYERFVENRLKDFPEKKGEILLKEGFDDFDKDIIKGFKISSKFAEDGFIVKDGNLMYDNSFSSIIDYKKDELKKIISDELFNLE